MSGLTPGGLAFALFCLLWTATTGTISALVCYVYLKTRWAIDFRVLISAVVTIAMLASCGQQVYTMANWDALKERERQDSILTHTGEHFFDVGSDKFIKGFYYTQILCYNIGGTLVVFWSFWIWANVWPLRGDWWRSKTYMNTAKTGVIAICILLFGVSQADVFKSRPMERFIISNVMLITVLGITPILFIMILYRFITVRMRATGHAINEMNKFPAENQNTESTGTQDSSTRTDNTLPSVNKSRASKTKILSTMLMVRFVSAIIIMSGLEAFHICFQVFRISKFGPGSIAIKKIPVTTAEQVADTYLFLPSTAQGWLVLLVFGTTEDYWKKIVSTISKVFCCCMRPCTKNQLSRESTVEIVPDAEWHALKLRPAPIGREGISYTVQSSVTSRPRSPASFTPNFQSHGRSPSEPSFPKRTISFSRPPRRQNSDQWNTAAAGSSRSGLQTAIYSWSVETLDKP